MPSTARRRFPAVDARLPVRPAGGRRTRVDRAADQLDYEIAGCLAEVDSGPALHFTNVEAASGAVTMPVVGNLLNSLPRFALGLGTTVDQIQASLLAAIEKPLPHRVLSSGPCQQEIVADPSLADELPIPRFFEKEGGAYVTAGAIVAKDRVSGHTNLSIARLMPLGGNRAFVGIAPNHHLAVLARAAHARGEKLDIAVCIGNHPAVLVAACLYLGLGEDELPIAGALLGEPLEVVRCAGSGLLVPAHCECVLEGTLDAGEPFMEGPVSEFHGMYENYGAGIVATFSRLTRRGATRSSRSFCRATIPSIACSAASRSRPASCAPSAARFRRFARWRSASAAPAACMPWSRCARRVRARHARRCSPSGPPST